MKTFNVVVFWNKDNQLVIEPTALACDNLIPLRAFTNRSYEVRLYTANEDQVSQLRLFPLEQMAHYLIYVTGLPTKEP